MDYFSTWGRNPLLLYLLAFLVTGLFVLPGVPWWYIEAPLWLIGLQVLFLVLVLSSLGSYCQKKGFNFSM